MCRSVRIGDLLVGSIVTLGNRLRLSIVVTAFACLGMPAIASAHDGNNDPNVVHACIANNSLSVRIVGVTGSCISSPASKAETPAHWDIQGPQGPQGIQGLPGIQGPQGDPGTDATHADPPCFDTVNFNRYVDCGNGTVTDTVTGLIWLKQWNCLPPKDWAAANQAAARLKNGDCGLTDNSSAGDWRLPTKDQWSATITRAVALGCTLVRAPTLTDDTGYLCYDLNVSSFEQVEKNNHLSWSMNTNEVYPILAWHVNLSTGEISDIGIEKSSALFVWPVRGGPR